VLDEAGLQLALQVDQHGLKVAILGPKVLEVGYQLDEESLIEGLIGLVFSYVERAALHVRAALSARCLSSLLEDHGWPELFVKGPEHLFERVDHLAVEESLQLVEDLNADLVLGQQV